MHTSLSAATLSSLRASPVGRLLAHLALGGWVFFSTPGVAAVAGVDPLAGLARVSDARLEALRGGLRMNGFEMRFGMRVQSSVSGVGEVVTELTWDEKRGWSAQSAHVQDAQGHGRHWDAADGKWKDDGPSAHGNIARAPVGHAYGHGDAAESVPSDGVSDMPSVGEASAVSQQTAAAATEPPPLAVDQPAVQSAGEIAPSLAAADVPPVTTPVMLREQPPPVEARRADFVAPDLGPAHGSASSEVLDATLVGEGVANAVADVANSTPPPVGAISETAVPQSPVALARAPGAGSPPPEAVTLPVAHSVAQKVGPQAAAGPDSGSEGFELVVANTGTTQILHQITSGHLAALITNQQNDVTIEHRAELDLTVANFTEVVGHAMHAIRARAIVGSGVNRY
jgi:hypothetical protein